MALSWEALVALSKFLDERSPQRIIEYGSGISTCLLADYGRTRNIQIQSFDSDAQWAMKTNDFLKEQGLDQWAKVRFADVPTPLEQVDFVLWDFDRNPKRVDCMATAFENVKPVGVMYVDDMQNDEIASACLALAGKIVGLVPVDAYRRYGAFVEREGR